jgi:two-component system, NarL family, nitrate/nitrite response regulator NarL
MSTPSLSSNPIRVLVVDDHSIVRAGLRMLIESQGRLEIVGEASSGPTAVAVAASTQPDIVLLDLDLGGTSGLDVIPNLLSAATKARVIILTGVRDVEQHREAVRRGAMGVVVKEQAAPVLLNAIEKVHAGEVWLERSMVASVLSQLFRPQTAPEDLEAAKITSFTDRECEVISLLCQGLSNKEVARRLSIAETTVGHHLRAIFRKLGVTSRLELVIYAYQHGLAKPPGDN